MANISTLFELRIFSVTLLRWEKGQQFVTEMNLLEESLGSRKKNDEKVSENNFFTDFVCFFHFHALRETKNVELFMGNSATHKFSW